MKSAVTVTTCRVGDSVIGESEHNLEGGESEGEAAVAADDAQPNKETRSTRQPRGITPIEQELKSTWEGRNDAKHVGNIGWLFGNWGKRPTHVNMRNHLDKVLKKQPAMVIGLAECQLESECVLQREPAAVAVNATPGANSKSKHRPEFPYPTLRGTEETSVLIAVRDQAGCALELLDLDRQEHGNTRKQETATYEAVHTLAASSRRSPYRTAWASPEKSTKPWWCTCTTSSPIWSWAKPSTMPFGTGFGRRSF